MQHKEYFSNLHDVEVNQKYADVLPYSFHLDMVYQQGLKFKHLILDVFINDVDAYSRYRIHTDGLPIFVSVALWAHDAQEDARKTHNNIKSLYGQDAAIITTLCTDYPGETRDERKPEILYLKLRENKYATFVKLCDLIANVKFSFMSNSRMLETYREEYFRKTKKYLYCTEFSEMFDYLEKIFAI